MSKAMKVLAERLNKAVDDVERENEMLRRFAMDLYIWNFTSDGCKECQCKSKCADAERCLFPEYAEELFKKISPDTDDGGQHD